MNVFFQKWGVYGEFQKFNGYMVQKNLSKGYMVKKRKFYVNLFIRRVHYEARWYCLYRRFIFFQHRFVFFGFIGSFVKLKVYISTYDLRKRKKIEGKEEMISEICFQKYESALHKIWMYKNMDLLFKKMNVKIHT